MELGIVLNQVGILFIIMIIGFAAGKAGVIDGVGSKKLAGVMLYVTSPMMVLKSFFIEFSAEKLVNIVWIMGMGFLMFILAIFLSKLLYGGFPAEISPVLRFTAIFSNCGYMGLPLMKALYGDSGVFYGSFYIVAFHIVLWTYGFVMFGGQGSRKQVIKRVFTNPSIIAVYVGMVIFIFSLKVPATITSAVTAVGDMTMPVSMLIIGAVISTAKFNTIFSDWRVYLSSAVRLILMPLIAFGLTRIPGIPALPAVVLVTALAMPVAANTTIFSEMFNKDAVFASKSVSVSTILSILTIPIIVSLLSGFSF